MDEARRQFNSDFTRLAVDNAALRAEIERLQEHKRKQADDIITLGQMVGKLEDEIERVRAIVNDACEVLRHYDLPEHAFHYERVLAGQVPLTIEQKVDKQ